jgi:hypothetical protein
MLGWESNHGDQSLYENSTVVIIDTAQYDSTIVLSVSQHHVARWRVVNIRFREKHLNRHIQKKY